MREAIRCNQGGHQVQLERPSGARRRVIRVAVRGAISHHQSPSAANMLFLGTTVLILYDLSYASRFWTQFEAWLGMQFAKGSVECSLRLLTLTFLVFVNVHAL